MVHRAITAVRLHKTKTLARVGVGDCFGRSGSTGELMQLYGLTAERIAQEVLRLVRQKKERSM